MATMTRRMFMMIGTVGLLLGGTAACGGDDKGTGPGGGVAGAYTLRTVNGQALPFAFINITTPGAQYKLEIMQSKVTLNADGTFSDQSTWRETENGQTATSTETTVGTYTRQGDALTFTDSEGEVSSASLSGGALVFVMSGNGTTYSARFTK